MDNFEDNLEDYDINQFHEEGGEEDYHANQFDQFSEKGVEEDE